MGKKKRKKRFGPSIMYDAKRNRAIAQHIRNYVENFSSLFIIEGADQKDIKKAIKTLLKAVNDLENNNPEDVYNIERYCEEYGDLEFDE